MTSVNLPMPTRMVGGWNRSAAFSTIKAGRAMRSFVFRSQCRVYSDT